MSEEIMLSIKNKPKVYNDILLEYFTNIIGTNVIMVEDRENGECEILLRFAVEKYSTYWPEDIKISWSDSEIYLCFYSGNRNEINIIFDDLIMILNESLILFEIE